LLFVVAALLSACSGSTVPAARSGPSAVNQGASISAPRTAAASSGPAQSYASIEPGYIFDDPDRKKKLTSGLADIDAAVAREMSVQGVIRRPTRQAAASRFIRILLARRGSMPIAVPNSAPALATARPSLRASIRVLRRGPTHVSPIALGPATSPVSTPSPIAASRPPTAAGPDLCVALAPATGPQDAATVLLASTASRRAVRLRGQLRVRRFPRFFRLAKTGRRVVSLRTCAFSGCTRVLIYGSDTTDIDKWLEVG
jgi:hypothetical protein